MAESWRPLHRVSTAVYYDLQRVQGPSIARVLQLQPVLSPVLWSMRFQAWQLIFNRLNVTTLISLRLLACQKKLRPPSCCRCAQPSSVPHLRCQFFMTVTLPATCPSCCVSGARVQAYVRCRSTTTLILRAFMPSLLEFTLTSVSPCLCPSTRSQATPSIVSYTQKVRAQQTIQSCFSMSTLDIRKPCRSARKALHLASLAALATKGDTSLSMASHGVEFKTAAITACSSTSILNPKLQCSQSHPHAVPQLLLSAIHCQTTPQMGLMSQGGSRDRCPTAALHAPVSSGPLIHYASASSPGHAHDSCACAVSRTALPWNAPRAHAFGVVADMIRPYTELCHFHSLQQSFPPKPCLQKEARALVDGMPLWQGCPLAAVAFFTDGSYRSHPPQATWAVAAFGQDNLGTWYWCGFQAGRLTSRALGRWGHSPFRRGFCYDSGPNLAPHCCRAGGRYLL